MLSRRKLRRLRQMYRKNRQNEQYDDEDEDEIMTLLPEMLEEMEQERRRSKIFHLEGNSYAKSPESETETQNFLEKLLMRTKTEVPLAK